MRPLQRRLVEASEYAQLWAVWPRPSEHPIAVAGRAFSATIRAANPPRVKTQREKVLELQMAYVRGDITEISLELELEHLPGGFR